MVDNLPKSGVKLTVEDSKQSEAALKRFQSYVDSISTHKAQGQLNALQKTIGNIGGKSSNVKLNKIFGSLKDEISGGLQQLGKAIPGFDKLTGVMGATSAQSAQLATALGGATLAIGAIAVATVGATAALAGFIAAGKRGIQIEVTAKAFGNTVQSFGDSTEVLQRLRDQTRGTISDFELMRLSVASLQGTSANFRKEVAPSLGTIIDATNRIGQATGQSAEIIREKFLIGLRRMSKKLVDDTGAMVDFAVANQKYADSVGKTVNELTELDKQAAFAKEAIYQLDKISKEAGNNNFADILARSGAVLRNTFDKLSVAILPAFKPLLGQFNVFLGVVESISSYALPVLKTLAEIVGTTITKAFDVAGTAIYSLFGGIGTGAGKVLPYAVALFQIFGDVAQASIRQVAKTTQSAIRSFASLANFFLKPLGKVGDFIANLFKGTNDQFNNGFEQLAFNVGRGGANIVGAFAAGLLRGGTKVAEAAGKIAQIVADFLVGFSPPKKGALAHIDQGAANIALAFAQGFTGGILPPIDEVASQIDQRLGSIGTFGLEQIKQAFGRLDLAIRPFTEQLQLAKADLEAIAGFIDPALKIAERQRKNLLKALGRGESIDIDTIRSQDAQIERLKTIQDMETDRVDQAELQLGLVTAAQSSERALLAIQQARLGTIEDIKEETAKPEKEAKEAVEKALKEPKLGGSGGGEPEQGEVGGFTPGEAPDLLSNESIANAKKQILAFGAGIAGAASQGISQGLSESGFNSALADFQGATGNVKNQLARAAGANPAKKILDKFSGLKDGITEILSPFQVEFERVFGALFGEEGSVSGFVGRYATLLSETFLGEGSVFQLVRNAITDLGTVVDTAISGFTTALTSINFTPFKTEVNSTFGIENEDSPFNQISLALKGASEIFDTFKTTASQIFNSLFGEKEGVIPLAVHATGDTIIAVFDDLFKPGGRIDMWMGNLFSFVNTTIDLVIAKFSLLTGSGEGSLSAALSSLGTQLDSLIVSPFKTMANSVVRAIEGAINAIIGTFNDLTIPGVPDYPLVDFGQPFPGYAKGGLGVKGSFIAGEKGAELITTKRPVNVFPNNATRALMDIAARPMPVYAGYGTSNNYNNSSNFNQSNTINVNSQKQALLMERQLRARMR